MQIELYNDWYVRTDARIGPYNVVSGTPTSEQIHNAVKIHSALSGYGWSESAIAGILGNMQHESSIDPAFIQATNRYRLPNSAANLSDVPNEVMQNFYMEYYDDSNKAYGIGLVQWDGLGITRQKLVGFCMNNGYIWYDGNAQMARLLDEYTRNIQWQTRTYYGVTWTWQNYVTNTRTPEESARIWLGCYEISSGLTYRQQNARFWYDYFTQTDWISGHDFASLALAYDPDITGVDIPYSQLDCIGFVNKVWQDIPIVAQNSWSLTSGTNSLWRSTRTFQTISPIGQNPTPELWYKDTISNCIETYGIIPEGALLFHQISDEGPPAIPSQYEGDGIGNFAHIGIFCGNNEVMQSGGRDSSTVPGGGVHRSAYDSAAWNYCAFVVWVHNEGVVPPTPGGIPPWLLVSIINKRKKVMGKWKHR